MLNKTYFVRRVYIVFVFRQVPHDLRKTSTSERSVKQMQCRLKPEHREYFTYRLSATQVVSRTETSSDMLAKAERKR